MGAAEIVELLAALADAGAKIAANTQQAIELFQKMNAEGRTELTADEMAGLVTARDDARAALEKAIASA